jgi:alpha-beta hydrolase superfamily lysophospholipase
MSHLLKQLVRLVGYGTVGALLALVIAYVVYLKSLPEPRIWQRAELDAEFRAADATTVKTLDDYRSIEERVFQQLREKVYDHIAPEDRRVLNRYFAGSLADPQAHPPDWNRTFELPVANPHGGVLLIHGLTDSPYSMRSLAQRLHAMGYWAVALRLPGHGTAPSGLLSFNWRDLAAAMRVAARHLRARIGPDRPLYLVGYSTGAALAVEYELARLQGEDLPASAGLILLSPAIGISPAAAFAVWQGRLAAIPGLENAAWTAMTPEYDPYKYNSFSVNAAVQVYALTQVIRERLDALASAGPIKGMPPILAFQSAIDDTVSAPAVVDALFRRLAPAGHQLVVFDINRHAEAEPLLRPGIVDLRDRMLKAPPQPFDLTVVTNENPRSAAVIALRRPALEIESHSEPIGLNWPREVFSLSHVALPFAPDDPVYGALRPEKPVMIFLGDVELHGERGLLALPMGDLIRLRHNPFNAYVEARIRSFLEPSR